MSWRWKHPILISQYYRSCCLLDWLFLPSEQNVKGHCPLSAICIRSTSYLLIFLCLVNDYLKIERATFLSRVYEIFPETFTSMSVPSHTSISGIILWPLWWGTPYFIINKRTFDPNPTNWYQLLRADRHHSPLGRKITCVVYELIWYSKISHRIVSEFEEMDTSSNFTNNFTNNNKNIHQQQFFEENTAMDKCLTTSHHNSLDMHKNWTLKTFALIQRLSHWMFYPLQGFLYVMKYSVILI